MEYQLDGLEKLSLGIVAVGALCVFAPEIREGIQAYIQNGEVQRELSESSRKIIRILGVEGIIVGSILLPLEKMSKTCKDIQKDLEKLEYIFKKAPSWWRFL